MGCNALSAADTIYVDAQSESCPGDGTAGDPFCTIQPAIDAADDGDSILVLPGHYDEPLELSGKSVELRSSRGEQETILVGTSSAPTLRITESNSLVEGFTVRGGWPGILVRNASTSLRSCVIRECRGAALDVAGASTVFVDSVDFTATPGPGLEAYAVISVYDQAKLELTGSRLFDNRVDSGGSVIRIVLGQLRLSDCDLVENDCNFESLVWIRNGTALLENNRIVDNRSELTGGDIAAIRADLTTSITIRNNWIGTDADPLPGTGIQARGSEVQVLIDSNHFQGFNNEASAGGAVDVGSGLPVICRQNMFLANRSTRGGGGVYISAPQSRVEDNLFESNQSGAAGGALLLGREGNRVRGNTFLRNEALRDGGAASIFGGGNEVSRNRFRDNASKLGNGGALYFGRNPDTVVSGNEIVRNRAGGSGGGIHTQLGTIILQNTIVDNVASTGGGVWVDEDVSGTRIVDSILWGNVPEAVATPSLTLPIIQFSDVQGGSTGIGNIAADPIFRDPLQHDYRLLCKSPCVNSGSGLFPLLRTHRDVSGLDQRRIGAFDMGADEVGLDLRPTGVARPGGDPVGFSMTHPSAESPVTSFVFLSSSVGDGLPVPGSGGRRLRLSPGALFQFWLSLDPTFRTARTDDCQGSETTPVSIPPRAPTGARVFFAAVSVDSELAVLSVTAPESFLIE
ncbi:MAG: right-handed parallel beta-helix repeat-containing protein [Planctomycetota bacterium]